MHTVVSKVRRVTADKDEFAPRLVGVHVFS